jgi:lipoprotein-anchoring transpeptidase ErfK/SrfK
MVRTRRFRLGALVTGLLIGAGVLWWSPLRLGASDDGMRLRVSLSARSMQVIENGDVVHTYAIAVGQPGNPTPTGSFRTGSIDWNPSWTPPPSDWAKDKTYQPPGAPGNPMQGVKIYFKAPWYFIHGTNNPGSIGEAASKGCIRMTESDAVSLARRIEQAGGSVPLLIEG